MDLITVIAVGLLLVVVLYLLSVWQRKISEAQEERVRRDIRDATDRGSDKAIAQYPLIDPEACIGCGTCIAACPEEGVLGLVDGIAHVIHGSRCIGHARCEVACPVAAIQVGLGDVALRPDIPVLSDDLESSVPGVHIAGELGGLALIRIAVEQGTQAVDAIARSLAEEGRTAHGRNVFDLLVVGAGPAGIAASLRSVERRLHCLTIDQDDIGGTVRKYPRRKLTLTGPLVLPLYGRVKREEYLKEELIEFWEEIIDEHQLDIRTGIKFQGLERQGDVFVARTSRGPIRARRVLLALGRRGTPRKLGAPGEEAEKVLYQLIDAASYTNEHVLVVGGGDSAIEAATALANQSGNVVTVSYRRDNFFRLKARNESRIEEYIKDRKLQVVFGSNVQSIAADQVILTHSEGGVDKTLSLKNDYVFVLAGGEPPYPLLKGMGVTFGGEEEDAELQRELESVGGHPWD